jgi:hypothetical protein
MMRKRGKRPAALTVAPGAEVVGKVGPVPPTQPPLPL